jgi:hypothetical protein
LQTDVVPKPSAKNAAAELTQLLPTNLIGSNAYTVKQPDITETKNARNAKAQATYWPACEIEQRFKSAVPDRRSGFASRTKLLPS